MSLNYIDFSLLLSAAWMAALAAVGSRSERVIGEGPTEFKLVLHSAVIVVALLAVIAFFFKFDFSRSLRCVHARARRGRAPPWPPPVEAVAS